MSSTTVGKKHFPAVKSVETNIHWCPEKYETALYFLFFSVNSHAVE